MYGTIIARLHCGMPGTGSDSTHAALGMEEDLEALIRQERLKGDLYANDQLLRSLLQSLAIVQAQASEAAHHCLTHASSPCFDLSAAGPAVR